MQYNRACLALVLAGLIAPGGLLVQNAAAAGREVPDGNSSAAKKTTVITTTTTTIKTGDLEMEETEYYPPWIGAAIKIGTRL